MQYISIDYNDLELFSGSAEWIIKYINIMYNNNGNISVNYIKNQWEMPLNIKPKVVLTEKMSFSIYFYIKKHFLCSNKYIKANKLDLYDITKFTLLKIIVHLSD